MDIVGKYRAATDPAEGPKPASESKTVRNAQQEAVTKKGRALRMGPCEGGPAFLFWI
jgi:hypothetical protein